MRGIGNVARIMPRLAYLERGRPSGAVADLAGIIDSLRHADPARVNSTGSECATTAIARSPAKRAAAPLHPLLHAWSTHLHLFADREDAGIAALERARVRTQAADGIARPAPRVQDAALLADGLHYETRIAERGILATRVGMPHDVANALIWLRHPHLKRALNTRQVEDIARVGPKQRTRAQCALTQFDEAGAIVWLGDPTLLPLWDAHDWSALFLRERDAWGTRIALTVFGHALLEHVWLARALPVAKALVVQLSPREFGRRTVGNGALISRWSARETQVARAIAHNELLGDPQELRPLPLAGIPGWHEDNRSESFFIDTACFRPLRPGRCYPAPLDIRDRR